MFDAGIDQAFGLRQLMGKNSEEAFSSGSAYLHYSNVKDIVLCMHSDPTSIKSAYQMMKTLATTSEIDAFKVYLFDEQTSRANKVFDNFSYACSVYLGIEPVLQGILPLENNNFSK
jgi:hypothetical protein